MSLKKMPFISAVRLARVDEDFIVPTALYYQDRKPFVGREALDRCSDPALLIEDFKVEVGANDPDAVGRKSAIAASSPRRTAVGLVKDFFDETLGKVGSWLDVQGLPTPNRILIAEPLSLGGNELASEQWLANYRRAIRKALPSRFVEVDFMPEPFAVFQYYRYGLRHPTVAENRKHVALVLDFGGGTFDASVIETAKSGDISQTGVNSRPLSAKSIHVGGFYINRLIAEDALFSVLSKQYEKNTFRKSLEHFYDNRNSGEEFIRDLPENKQSFFRHMKRLLADVERAKIGVCNGIANWRLDADLAGAVSYPINVPVNPFSTKSEMASVRFDAGKFRALYEERIWKQKLRQTISSTIDRARAELRGQDISIVLLSGGSSNIRWLRPLIEQDLKSLLGSAQVLELSENFQEIVAKGLATECARRFYTEGQGDFRAVTYNRLCLALRVDDGELEIKRLRPLRGALSGRTGTAEVDDGVLLPAASSLRGLTDQALAWKVRLSRPPKRHLEYFFMRSSFDPDDLDALHNIGSTKVFTPSKANFQQGIEIELEVREDGTATPSFVYGRDNLKTGAVVEGKPFFMDMTFAAEEAAGETYLGFDFGTSTSACSIVSSSDIQFIEQRSRSADWRELAELISDLPYPIAAPLARFVSEMDTSRRAERGREAAEAMLTLAAYVCFRERCAARADSALFKAMQHRSAGPLWNLLKQTLKSPIANLLYGAAYKELLEGPNFQQLDEWISQIATAKHGKLASIDYVSMLGMLANVTARALGDARLGVFEDVTSKRFGRGQFTGIFRSLTGSGAPFIHVWTYEGSEPFTDAEVLLVHPERGVALSLSPLYIWGLEPPRPGYDADLFEFDSDKSGILSYKAVQIRDEFRISDDGPFTELWDQMSELRVRDQPASCFEQLKLTSHATD